MSDAAHIVDKMLVLQDRAETAEALAVEQARWILEVLASGDLPAALHDCNCMICQRHRAGIELRDRASKLLAGR